MSATWLVASALTGQPVGIDDPYPHVCSSGRTPGGSFVGRQGCAACAGPRAPETLDLDAQFRGRHNCEPAGRGQTDDDWSCSECGQAWKRQAKTKAGVTTWTWWRHGIGGQS